MVSEKFIPSGSRSLRLILSIASFLGAGFLAARAEYLLAVTLLITGLLLLWQITRIFESTNEAITGYFDSLRNEDTTGNFPLTGNKKSLIRLYESMNKLNSHFQEIRLRNEYNETYYRTLIQHTSAGLLVLNSSNRIEVINKAACIFAGISPDSTNPDLLRIKYPAFYEAICNLKPGVNVTYRNLVSNNLQLLSFRATMIRRNDVLLKVISIQDIRHELESKELESYRKLISVMTHEIMNLLTPLTSAARELYSMFCYNERPGEMSQIDSATLKTTVSGLHLIEEQSNGLLNFVNSYRKISKIPQPEFATFEVEEWTSQIKIVYSGKMKEQGIAFNVTTDKSVREVIADKKLLNQVLINLINNALDAVLEIPCDRRIDIHFLKDNQNRTLVRITNNGPLIPPELQDKIFVPFFTTKTNGSGIGLSISQEIMKLHNGSLAVVSSKENQTSFILEF